MTDEEVRDGLVAGSGIALVKAHVSAQPLSVIGQRSSVVEAPPHM